MPKSCLVIIDMLNDFLDSWDKDRKAHLIQCTNDLIDAFRNSQLPVIWVRQEFMPDLSDAFLEMRDKRLSITIKGTRGAQIHDDLDWRSDDTTIVKKRYSAFFRTELDAVLTEFGADEPVFCGVNTHACIRTAAIDAYQRDLRVILASECIDSYDDEHARISLDYMKGKIARVMTNAEIDAMLSTS